MEYAKAAHQNPQTSDILQQSKDNGETESSVLALRFSSCCFKITSHEIPVPCEHPALRIAMLSEIILFHGTGPRHLSRLQCHLHVDYPVEVVGSSCTSSTLNRPLYRLTILIYARRLIFRPAPDGTTMHSNLHGSTCSQK